MLSITERRGNPRQVRFKKMNASEPPKTCRKHEDGIRTEAGSLPQDKFGSNLFYCPNGARHRGGMSLNQAFAWNMGTCRTDDEAKQAPDY